MGFEPGNRRMTAETQVYVTSCRPSTCLIVAFVLYGSNRDWSIIFPTLDLNFHAFGSVLKKIGQRLGLRFAY